MPPEQLPVQQNTQQLKDIAQNGEHSILQRDAMVNATRDLEVPLEGILLKADEIAKNTTPKDVQKIKIEGIEVITLKGDKGEPGNVFADLTPEQKAEIKGDKGDALTFEVLSPEQKKELTGPKGDTPTNEQLISLIDPLIPEPIPGKTPTKEEITALIEPLIPSKEELRGVPGEAPTREYISTLIKEQFPVEEDPKKEAERLAQALNEMGTIDYDKLKNLPNLDVFRRPNIASKDYATRDLTDVSMQGIVAGQLLQWDGTRFIPYTISSASSTQVFGEVPGGAVPGTVFTIANTPVVGTVRIYRGGAYQQAGAGKDYTIASSTITLAATLSVGEVLQADYNY